MSLEDAGPANAPVGLIGCGLLGAAFARRLASAGRTVAAYDRDAARLAEVARLDPRIEVVRSVEAVVASCSLCIVAVYSAAQVTELLSATVASRSRVTLLCATTLSPEDAMASARDADARGVLLVELPVSGSAQEVAAGEALGLLGGAPLDVDPHLDIVAVLTPRFFRFDAIGDAARTKLAINLVLEANRAALAEGLILAEALGLDVEAFATALAASAAHSRVMDRKADRMVRGDFAPQGRAAQSLKDMGLILEAGDGAGQPLPFGQTVRDLLAAAVASGDGDADSSVVIRELRRRRRVLPSVGARLEILHGR